MKKIFSFLCMFMAMTAMISCSSSKRKKEQPAPEMPLWIISLSVRVCVLT